MTVVLLSDAATVVLSVLTAAFVSGMRWGSLTTTITTISERLARIEGMFELRLKDKDLG